MSDTVAMKLSKRLLALPLLLAAAACSSMHVTSDHDPQADLSRLHSYQWAPRAKPADPLVANTLVVDRVHDAIDRALQAKGFVPATSGKPDFVVDFSFASRGRTDVVSMPGWGAWRRWGYAETRTIVYVEGTLVIGFVDPATQKLLWLGAGTRPLDDDSGGVERVNEVVDAILAQYPPK